MISLNLPNNNHLIFSMAPPSKVPNGQEQPKQQSYLFQTSPHVEKCTDMYGYGTLYVYFCQNRWLSGIMVWTENDTNFIINIYGKHLQIFCKVLTYFSIYLLSQKTLLKAFSAYLYTIYCDSSTVETFDISFLFRLPSN